MNETAPNSKGGSMYQWLTDLPDYLDKWRIEWVGVGDWETHAARGPNERDYTPVAVVNHHTASTDWYPVDRLRNKCNLYIDPAGLVHVLSLGYQYDTGYVDAAVLQAHIDKTPPPPPSDYTEADRVLGNQWFIDIEVGHWGGGQPIPTQQRDALIRTNAALLDMQDWYPDTSLNDHKGVTRRKVDVRWENPYTGNRDTIEEIRADTARLLQDEEFLDMTEDQMRRIVREELEAVLGGGPIKITENRTGNAGVVNSVWWAKTNGRMMWEQLQEATEPVTINVTVDKDGE